MNTLSSTRLHFQCSFEITAPSEASDSWSEMTKTIRNWIQQSPKYNPPQTNAAFHGSWFFVGGEWRAPGPGYHFVKAIRFIGTGNDRAPQHWAVRYEHNCSAPGRIWRVDIGITRTAERNYRFSVSTSYYMRSGYIGLEPSPPYPSSPGIVVWLLRLNGWSARSGSEKIRPDPVPLGEGDGMQFKKLLEDPDRLAPIVLVSRDFKTGRLLVDPKRLSWLLAGAASVYESSSSALDKELEWCLGARFSCWNGMVRVYQPGLKIAIHAMARRQRYFSGKQIDEIGADAVVETLVRGIARRPEPILHGNVTSIEGVVSVEREYRLAEFKAQQNSDNQSEWIILLEETNQSLQSTLNERDEVIQRLQNENADHGDTIARLEYEKKALQTRFNSNGADVQATNSLAQVALSMVSLPGSLHEIIELICKIYPGRIAFTESGLKAVSNCDFDDYQVAWKAFRSMATHLHDIFFAKDGKPGDIEAAFYERSGFRLAMTEGSLTKDDNKLMKKREDIFQGAAIDITPHVKFDKDTTRAYFCPYESKEGKVIVVGFVGHLNTAGTRRMKK